jgi:hypothetical protein
MRLFGLMFDQFPLAVDNWKQRRAQIAIHRD